MNESMIYSRRTDRQTHGQTDKQTDLRSLTKHDVNLHNKPTTAYIYTRGVARNLIWVGINCTISNLSWVNETKQPHKKFKVD